MHLALPGSPALPCAFATRKPLTTTVLGAGTYTANHKDLNHPYKACLTFLQEDNICSEHPRPPTHTLVGPSLIETSLPPNPEYVEKSLQALQNLFGKMLPVS